MLREHGHDVELLEADNRSIDGMVTKIAAAGSLFHSSASSRKMTELVRRFQPDVVHVHNWFPLLSPSIIDAAVAEGVPVVQTLHNFRMLCANGMLYRDGRICQDCVGKDFPLDGVIHGCYSGSRVGTAMVTAAFAYHRLAHRWDGVSAFIALSEFQRSMLERGRVDVARMVVKPNFVKDSGAPGDGKGAYALFVGRLIAEKGIRTVLNAWRDGRMRMPLKIMGDGPLADEVRRIATAMPRVQYLGQQTSAEVQAAMAEARFVICASECHEAFGLTIVEAYAQGTPVLASDLESVSELVRPGETGRLFTPGDAGDLAAKASLLMADDATYRQMRRRCRALYEERYTDTVNYELLMEIYRRVCVSTVERNAIEKAAFA